MALFLRVENRPIFLARHPTVPHFRDLVAEAKHGDGRCLLSREANGPMLPVDVFRLQEGQVRLRRPDVPCKLIETLRFRIRSCATMA